MRFIQFTETAKGEFGTKGLATIEIGGKQAEVAAYDAGDHITLYGIAVKYRTGKKIWSGSAIYWKATGGINNINGPIDNRQRPGIAYVLGFYSDYADKVKSQHVGN